MNSIHIPLALSATIEFYNTQIQEAAKEIMTIMNLTPEDGWRLDMTNKLFVNIKQVDTTTVDK